MIDIFIDVETFSSTDLIECGLYRYVEAEDFEIMLLSFQIMSGAVQTIDFFDTTPEVLESFVAMILRPDVLLHAHNAAFERITINKHFKINIPITRWRCTMVKAYMCGLPGALEKVAIALELMYQKLSSGKALITYFSKPCKPTKANGGRIRNLPQHDPEKWNNYKDYNRQDVVVERLVYDNLSYYEISESEQALYCLDQEINDRGCAADAALAVNALAIDAAHVADIMQRLRNLTGLTNPNSLTQIKDWLARKEPAMKRVSLNKDGMEDLLARIKSPAVREVLQLRNMLSNLSITKYQTILDCLCADGRLRGLFQYYGAGRTGRFAGRLLQPHNLVKTEIKPVHLARRLLIKNDAFLLQGLWDSIPYCLSQLIRTALVPAPGHTFAIFDFSAIEARVLSWLAGEKWRLDVFRGDGKIYEASAAKMFKVPIESIGKDSPLRARGKVSELALGYQGAAGALIRMGALKMGIAEAELSSIVYAWRKENKRIVAYWYALQEAFEYALLNGRQRVGSVQFIYRNKRLLIQLPSGRQLVYQQPKIMDGQLTYMGVDGPAKRWARIDTYGGKIAENITQAIARDLLAEAMLRVDAAGFKIVLHVHDEIVCEVPEQGAAGAEITIRRIMRALPTWAAGLPMDVSSTISPFYRKD